MHRTVHTTTAGEELNSMSIKNELTIVLVSCFVLAISSPAGAEDPYPIAWSSQPGSIGSESSRGVALDSNGIAYIVGHTTGHMG